VSPDRHSAQRERVRRLRMDADPEPSNGRSADTKAPLAPRREDAARAALDFLSLLRDATRQGTDLPGAVERAAVALPSSVRDVAQRAARRMRGDYAQDEHDRIGRLVVRLNIAKLVVVGDRARHIHAAAGLEGSWDGESVFVPDLDAAYDLLREQLRAGDVVLVKSSKSAGLRFLGDKLGGVEGATW